VSKHRVLLGVEAQVEGLQRQGHAIALRWARVQLEMYGREALVRYSKRFLQRRCLESTIGAHNLLNGNLNKLSLVYSDLYNNDVPKQTT